MQSLLFVFLGLPEKNSDANLTVLMERMEKKCRESMIALQLTRKGELLLGRLDEVGFYVCFLKSKNELKDWYEMARDFELKVDKSPIDKNGLVKRYAELKKSADNLYKPNHYDVGLAIMEEMERFSDVKIFSFQ